MIFKETLITRFKRNIKVSDKGCWEWTGCKSNGYGRFWVKENNCWKKDWAHRVSWKMFRGLIPKGLCVCHACDNPCCVNPEHLWIGSQSENSLDMIKKGRQVVNMNIKNEGIETRFKSGRKPLKTEVH